MEDKSFTLIAWPNESVERMAAGGSFPAFGLHSVRRHRSLLRRCRMKTAPASEAQVAAVESACREFRDHWCSFAQMPKAGDFAGTLEDIEALDYLDYEGLGYPASSLVGASLVWGRVLERQLGMSWVTACRGEQMLAHDSPGNRITIWPFARVLEVQTRSLPQFGRCAWLLDRVIRDCLQFGDLSDGAIAWGRHIIETYERQGAPWS